MKSKGKILGLILEGKLFPDKEEKYFLKIHSGSYTSLENISEIKAIISRAWYNQINKKKLKSIEYVGEKSNVDNWKQVLVSFPSGIFSSHDKGGMLGLIEVEKDDDLWTVNFISQETGEIRQSKYREE